MGACSAWSRLSIVVLSLLTLLAFLPAPLAAQPIAAPTALEAPAGQPTVATAPPHVHLETALEDAEGEDRVDDDDDPRGERVALPPFDVGAFPPPHDIRLLAQPPPVDEPPVPFRRRAFPSRAPPVA